MASPGPQKSFRLGRKFEKFHSVREGDDIVIGAVNDKDRASDAGKDPVRRVSAAQQEADRKERGHS